MPPALRTEFLVADNAHARWVRRSTGGADFATVQELHADPAPPAEPQGVVFESGGGRFNVEEGRRAVERRRYRFSGVLAEAINARAAKDEFDRLCLVAPARTLAEIRRQLTPEASRKLVHTLAKDLTKTPDHALRTWLGALELH
jgi:protein required for attachment to host cells